MNNNDALKQIQQMVCFTRQEAEEKANEISVSSEEEFNIEKLQLVEAEKRKIRQEYERKEKQVQVHKKIEYSMQLNASRIKVLQAQDDLVNSMKESAAKELLRVSQDHSNYKNLLKDLIVQEEYAKKAKVHQSEIIVNKIYLPPAPSSHDEHGSFCSGGVSQVSRLPPNDQWSGFYKASSRQCWLLEMGRLCWRTLLMLGWMLSSVKNCQRYAKAYLVRLLPDGLKLSTFIISRFADSSQKLSY